MIPNLLVLGGLPSSGKSSIAEYLVNRYDFIRVSSDVIREDLYGVTDENYYDYVSSADFRKNENVLFSTMRNRKINLLGDGRDVVMDTVSLEEQTRQYNLDTRCYIDSPRMEFELLTKKFFIYLDVSRKEIEKRSNNRGRESADYEEWSSRFEFPLDEGYTSAIFNNDTPTGQVRVLEYLDDLFLC
ncbi:MAG: putative kinase [Patescibacteria group bacterium]|jgi:predicted kinase